ncbi:MAG TPA: sigma-70 family RNA polymerase sigma factor [Steroidobacteraceae bacterium]|nr:sigma-70 family RNA polymerase sigma factor [Steroidobacteraceae bacterium]
MSSWDYTPAETSREAALSMSMERVGCVINMRAIVGFSRVPVRIDDAQLLVLLAQVQGGSLSALGQLYSQTVGKVYGLAMRITANRADAEEVTSDVYQQVWRAASQFNPERGTPAQWIMVIARNRALDCYRRRKADTVAQLAKIGQAPSPDHMPTAEEVVQQFEAGTLVRAALSSLNEVQAQLIGLAFFEGLTHREIATRTQLPLGTVKSHLFRALRVLRRTLTSSGMLEPFGADGAEQVEEPDAPIAGQDERAAQAHPTQ